jgi:hypothetical protein
MPPLSPHFTLSLPSIQIPPAFVTIVLIVASPFYFISAFSIFWLFTGLLRQRFNTLPARLPTMRLYLTHHVFTTSIVVTTLLYPSVTKGLLSIFDCTEIDDETEVSSEAKELGQLLVGPVRGRL